MSIAKLISLGRITKISENLEEICNILYYTINDKKGEIQMDKLKEILEQIRPDIDFDEEKSLIDGGVLDSIDIIAIVTEINDTMDVDINVQYLLPENFNSMEAIYELICKLQDE